MPQGTDDPACRTTPHRAVALSAAASAAGCPGRAVVAAGLAGAHPAVPPARWDGALPAVRGVRAQRAGTRWVVGPGRRPAPPGGGRAGHRATWWAADLGLPRCDGHLMMWSEQWRCPMPRTHRPYPPEFRAEAVRLARGSDKSIPALAADLGVSSEALRHWLRQADADAGRGQPGDLTTDEREELRRLRREVKSLQQEREILRKAAAYFAKETL